VAEKLAKYKKKRDFKATPEPAGGTAAAEAELPRFVIQLHQATRMHWDLRLEHDGVAASWAIPNGIPQAPEENRKAVHTEDHPLEYLEFEGDIPKGNYGAGTMRIWDRGTYELEKWKDREVIVRFHGEQVQGRYVLFKTSDDEKDWMIHRMDPPADPDREPMPERIVPMLAKLGKLPRDEERHAFEIKWDGIRAIVYSRPGRLRIESRNLADITVGYPEVRAMNRALGSHDVVLDGELIAFDEQGRPSFSQMQQRMHLTSEPQIKRRMKQVPVTYAIFDLLYLDGHSLMGLPYSERRERLEELELEGPAWRTPPNYPGDGKSLLEATEQQGLEGVVAKRLDSPYEPGRRSNSWIKVKNKRSAEVVIGGWLPGEGRRANRIGALLMGHHDGDGDLRYAGRVGTGFSEDELDFLQGKLAPLERDRSPFSGEPKPPRGSHWVKPELAAEVEFGEWTKDGLLRHPSYQGLRDIDPADIVMPGLDAEPTEGPGDSALGPLRPLKGGSLEATVDGRTLKLSNFDKVLYPKAGFTKGQLIEYYARVSEALLPHLHDRPLTMKRYPNGVEGKFFYEKQCPSHRPDWVQTAPIWSGRNKKEIDYCLANDLATLVWTSNLADIELHTSLSLAEEIERPTMMVFDLDPGAPADIVQCCQVSVWLRELFDPLGLESFAKTSGSKGLQVYVPLNTPVTYDETKPFAKAVAELLEKNHPDAVVSRMSKELRPGKVLVDWSQNDQHKTTVCVYSMRAKERPTVSTPVSWEEVDACLEAGDPDLLVFEWDKVLERVEVQGDLFAPVLALKQELPRF
jgi:bifunctional non-homologous end joining protein LigD